MPSITVTYWAEPTRGDIVELDGTDEFRRELSQEYEAVVHARSGEMGGLYDLTVEIVSNLSLHEFVKLVADGLVFDLLKSGAKSLVLRPFLDAYRRLRQRNQSRRVDIEKLHLVLADSMVVIDSLGKNTIEANIKAILESLATKYSSLVLGNGEGPFEIQIPVFEDTSSDRICHYRVILDVDETLRIEAADYFKLWGLYYDRARLHRIYEVATETFVDEAFYTRELYWREAERRWRTARNSSKSD